MSDAPEAVTLHSSWRGLLGSTAGALLVFAAGVYGVVGGGWRLIPTTLFVIGALLVLVVTLDYPVASRFTADAVERRMMLRRQRISWERVDLLTRARPGMTRGLRGLKHGGLVAVVGRRRYLLVDQPESPEEFDAVATVLDDRFFELGLERRMRTDDGTPPTWLYRRSKWAPDGVGRR